ncbi:MAG: hypothetical protein U1D00_13025, partial [Mycobacterium sp.]|nr:hypothetical protein [Mycobacterium sp.]
DELEIANQEIRAQQSAPPGSRLVGYAGGYWRELQLTVFEWIGRGKWLTQFGLKGRFRSEPRYDFPIHETALSMSLGRKSPDQMMRLVMRRPSRRRDRAQVRYFFSDNLWSHQYSVALTPNDTDKEHVSVYCALPRQQIDVVEAKKCWRQPGRVTMDDLAEEVRDE